MKGKKTSCTQGYLSNLPKDRRPRIALMGEFSAGKSTLANLMVGSVSLPMQVVATQLPPIWVSYGRNRPVAVDLNGSETPCDLDALATLDPIEIAFVRIESEERVLEECDIIDMPGISDPNMSDEIWQRLLPVIDGVVWCTAATQAWRQSEAAVWESIPEEIRRHSILLITRSDIITSHRDRDRVLNRVRAETFNLFRQVQMISLVEARDAIDDPVLWRSCGAEDFVDGFLGLLGELNRAVKTTRETERNNTSKPDGAPKYNSNMDLTDQSFERVLPKRPIRSTNLRSGSTLDPRSPESFTPKFS